MALLGLAVYLTLAARPIVASGGHLGHGGSFPLDFAAPFGWTPFAISMRVALLGALASFGLAVSHWIAHNEARRGQREAPLSARSRLAERDARGGGGDAGRDELRRARGGRGRTADGRHRPGASPGRGDLGRDAGRALPAGSARAPDGAGGAEASLAGRDRGGAGGGADRTRQLTAPAGQSAGAGGQRIRQPAAVEGLPLLRGGRHRRGEPLPGPAGPCSAGTAADRDRAGGRHAGRAGRRRTGERAAIGQSSAGGRAERGRDAAPVRGGRPVVGACRHRPAGARQPALPGRRGGPGHGAAADRRPARVHGLHAARRLGPDR